jgi:hypothetical protein
MSDSSGNSYSDGKDRLVSFDGEDDLGELGKCSCLLNGHELCVEKVVVTSLTDTSKNGQGIGMYQMDTPKE